MKTFNSNKLVDSFIEKLPPKQFKQVMMKLWSLRKNPLPYDSLKLKGYDDLYRVTVGEYRIIYRFDEKTIFIEAIGKRNDDDVYKKVGR